MSDYSIKWMTKRHVPKVFNIAERSFNLPYWNIKDFAKCLFGSEYSTKVIEIEGETVAYILYRLQENEVDIISWAVEPNFRRKGIGTRMINSLVRTLYRTRRNEINCVVNERNLEAQLLLKKRGFKSSVLRNFFDEDDGYLFSFRVNNKLKKA